MDKQSYKFISFNCKNAKRSLYDIRELCKTGDLIALQETWLLPHELPLLDTISEDFSSTGVSAVDVSAGILRGRPHGGVALLWRRSLFQDVSVIQCSNPRVCAIKVMAKDKPFLVTSVYMPVDEIINLVDFTDVLSSVSAVIDNCGVDCVYMFGDFNAHPTERFYRELLDFCADQKWSCIDTDRLGLMSDTYTFISESHGSKRWLDHCVVTEAAAMTVDSVSVLYDVMWSDHFPLVIQCNLNLVTRKLLTSDNICNSRVMWGERSPQQIQTYQHECHERLRLIDFPQELSSCCDRMCNNVSHNLIIDKLYHDVVQAMTEAALIGREGSGRGRKKVVVGWNRHVADAHWQAKQKFFLWVWYGKPSSGHIYYDMCETRKVFKSRLKWCQDHEVQIKMDILASHHSNNDFRAFWKNTNNLKCRPGLPVSVSGVTEPKDIANLFKRQFHVQSPLGPSRTVLSVEAGTEPGLKFSARDIARKIQSMAKGKSPGHDGLSIEHLRYAGPHLSRVVAMLFSFCLTHSYMPSEMLRTVVVPVVKNKTGDLADKANYRPISLATVISKVLDGMLNTQVNRCTQIHDNQFGFRPGLSTESAVLCLKHAVNYYAKRNTSVFCCFLDLSRAFDLVSYDILWQKLEKSQLPVAAINILKYWYGNQVNSVRWAGSMSDTFGLECGVRQGGLTSPTLFNLYVNDLIGELSSVYVGCRIDGLCVNNISYADDMALLSASPCGLRKLIAICEKYAESHGLIYNVKKSEVMVFEAGGKSAKLQQFPPIFLNGAPLRRVFSFKYLGHILTPDLKDDADIERERRALSVRANMLARRFARCTRDVKVTLFRAYCTSFYSCSLWARYTQKAYNALRIQYNNAFRVLLGLPRFCSASGMFADVGVDCFHAIMRKRCASLVRRVREGSNSMLSMIAGRLDCKYVNRCCAVSHGAAQQCFAYF